jgi:hypothetical protein
VKLPVWDLAIVRSGCAIVVRSLAVLLAALPSLPPDTVAVLVTDVGAFAATFTVRLIGWKLPPAATFSPVCERSALVGAGRFERPTPCAQDGFWPAPETACFQAFLFQADAASVLNSVESY